MQRDFFFFSQIKIANLSKKCLVSYDVTSLFTNIPLQETIIIVPNAYSCKDTFSFVSQIKNANLSKTLLVSYNVTSLFTNIQLQENTDIAINLIFNHNLNLNITRKWLKKLFLFGTS